ncbi:MAG: hypothetical protein JW883_00415 [Deltaproteobacteria bacterium]|nr:hypothetical protein [Deltaproteobacteria bacterium]
MAINWDNFEKGLDDEIKAAGSRTDERLASRISSLTRLTDEEVVELFPEPADLEQLKDLMRIVKSAEGQNVKVTKIVENIESFAGIVVKLLDKLS